MKRRGLVLVAVIVVLAAGCSSDDGSEGAGGAERSSTTRAEATTSTTEAAPEPLEDQTAPASVNGLTVQGDTIWITSIEDDQIVQIDRQSGAILQRFDTAGAGPDDVDVAPDGSVWSTGFTNGDVGRIADGEYEVVKTLVPGINPIAVADDGLVWIGTYGPEGSLYRIDPPNVAQSGPAPKTLGSMPDINAFGILDDGRIVAPAGGIAGPGSVVVWNPEDGGLSTVADGLPPVAAGTVDDQGDAYVLANITGEVFAVDVDAGTTKVIQTVEKGAPFDNLAFAADGTLYLSSFVTPTITEVQPDGTERVITIGS